MNFTKNNNQTTRSINILLFFLQFLLYFVIYLLLEKISWQKLKKKLSCKKSQPKPVKNKLNSPWNISELEQAEHPKVAKKFTTANQRTIISVKNLTKIFGKFKAVDDVSFDVSSSQVTAILGHNGAGKSTLINILCGVLKPSSGNFEFLGIDAGIHSSILNGNIGYCAAFDILYD